MIKTLAYFIDKLNYGRRSHHKFVYLKYNNLIMELLQMFSYLGLIRGYHVSKSHNLLIKKKNLKKMEKKHIEVVLKMKKGMYIFENIKLISKPSYRIYVNIVNMSLLKKNLTGSDIFLIKTKNGLRTDEQCLQENVGGEVLLKISLIKI